MKDYKALRRVANTLFNVNLVGILFTGFNRRDDEGAQSLQNKVHTNSIDLNCVSISITLYATILPS